MNFVSVFLQVYIFMTVYCMMIFRREVASHFRHVRIPAVRLLGSLSRPSVRI
jgi:hypothetical protein